MSYFPATQACNGPNGTRPLPAAMVARSQRQVAAINAGANRARAAVFGYCTNPGGFPGSVNLQNEITSAPAVVQTIQALAGTTVDQVGAGTTATGSVAPTTQGTAAAAAAGLVTPSGSNPVCWSDRPVATVPVSNPIVPPPPGLSLPNPSNVGLGDYPPWGDAYGPAGVDLTGAATSVANWFQNNPAISVAIMLAAVALLLGRKS